MRKSEFGIYVDVEPTEKRMKDGHRLYVGKCSICGKIVLQRENEFRTRNKKCQHRFQRINIENRRLRNIFKGMKQRCYNESDQDFKTYGGKGIEICDEWLDNPSLFEMWSLENGYSDELTIDRINSRLGYCPNNCRWITNEENARYKSTSHLIEVNGETRTGREWALICGLGVNTINEYLRSHDVDDVKEFIANTIDNGLPFRNGNNDSYINAYFRAMRTDIVEEITYTNAIHSEEYLLSGNEVLEENAH